MNNKIKICILGSNGMVGHLISHYLKEQGFNIIGVARKKNPYLETFVCDITEENNLRNFLITNNFDFIVNSVGILNKACDQRKDQAVYINSYLPHFLTSITKDQKTKIIQLSTDCVFSGRRGHYTESDYKDGETFYDLTKSLGEIHDSKNLTFRNSIIGPDSKPDGIGLFNWFMKQKTTLSGYSQAYWNGVTTLTLAKAIEKSFFTNITGIYHLVNNDHINKYDLLKLFNNTFRNGTINIIKDEKLSINKTLINTRSDFEFIVDDYPTMISNMKDWIENHKELYPHYISEI